MIYLDNAATTFQKPCSVTKAVFRAISQMTSPGRGSYPASKRASETVFSCREAVTELFDVPSPEQVVFTFNATHGLNIAIRSVVKPGDTVLISGYEHNAVTRPLHDINGVSIKTASGPLFDQTAILEAFEKELTADVSAVITTHVSNVFGFVLPIDEIARLCNKRHVPLIIDASQSAGCIPLSLRKLNASFVAMPGHKGLYGPQGTGILLCNAPVEPVLFGGTGSASRQQVMPEFLPDRLEAGTQNVPGIAGLAEGLKFVRRTGVDTIRMHERKMIQTLAEELGGYKDLDVFYGRIPGIQTGVLSFRHKERDCEEVGEYLAERGIAVRTGLHCAPLAHETAGTLETGTIRVSVSAFTKERDIYWFLRELRGICH